MTKSLGPFDYNAAPKPPSQNEKRKRTGLSWAFDLFFPLVIGAVAFLVGRTFLDF